MNNYYYLALISFDNWGTIINNLYRFNCAFQHVLSIIYVVINYAMKLLLHATQSNYVNIITTSKLLLY